MAHDVFVSHSVKDKAVAEKIVARLEAESVRCWVAPRDVVPGADWGESIIDAIESSRIMVLIFSKNANGSSQIKREVERAVDKNVYTIPFRVEDIEPTKSLEYFISTSQWMDAFTPPLEQHLDKLARAVKTILARPAVAPAETSSKPPEPIRRDETPAQAVRASAPHSPVWLKPAAVIAGVLILGAAVWYSQQRAHLGEEKKKNAAVPDTSLLATAVDTPQNSNSATNQAEDVATQPNARAPDPRIIPFQTQAETLPESAKALVRHWRKTTIVSENPRDEHLVLHADGTAENWIVTATSRTEKTTGRWSVEGTTLKLDLGENEISQPFTLYEGTARFPKYSEPTSILGKD